MDVENVPQASHVEAVYFLVLLRVGGPCRTAIEKSAEHTGLVDTQCGLLSQAGVVPDSLG